MVINYGSDKNMESKRQIRHNNRLCSKSERKQKKNYMYQV